MVVETFTPEFHSEDDVLQMKYSQLGNTDMNVSLLGFGGSAIGGHHCPVDRTEAVNVVRQALKKGLNYVDTAPWYGFGVAEKVLGQALETVPRRAYYVATKVGRYEPATSRMFDFSAARTLRSVEDSLRKLGCGYLDVIQIHDLEFAPSLDVILNETLPCLQSVKNAGKARYIGITGYPLETLKTVVDRSRVPIDTVLSYCRCCLHDTGLLDYVPFFKARGVGVIDAAGMGMGLYTNTPLPDWHPAGPEIRLACRESALYCQARDVDLAKLALHFNLMQDGPDVHLISCAVNDILDRNLDVCRRGVSAAEAQVLTDIQKRYFEPLQRRHWEGVELQKYREKLSNT